MKQHVIQWFIRNGFNFWKIENSKGKIVADNSPNKAGTKEDNKADRLTLEIDALESLSITEKYTVYGLVKNGQDWTVCPFYTTAPQNSFGNGGGGGGTIEIAMQLARMQANEASSVIIQQFQREKEERERKESEGLSNMIKPLIPMLAPILLPTIIKGFFDLSTKSPQILAFMSKMAENPTIQAGITQAFESYFTQVNNNNANQSTEITAPIN